MPSRTLYRIDVFRERAGRDREKEHAEIGFRSSPRTTPTNTAVHSSPPILIIFFSHTLWHIKTVRNQIENYGVVPQKKKNHQKYIHIIL